MNNVTTKKVASVKAEVAPEVTKLETPVKVEAAPAKKSFIEEMKLKMQELTGMFADAGKYDGDYAEKKDDVKEEAQSPDGGAGQRDGGYADPKAEAKVNDGDGDADDEMECTCKECGSKYKAKKEAVKAEEPAKEESKKMEVAAPVLTKEEQDKLALTNFHKSFGHVKIGTVSDAKKRMDAGFYKDIGLTDEMRQSFGL